MLIEVKVPVLAESVPDATLLDWYKQVGESVQRGDMLIDLETDKVTLEIAAPESGVVKALMKQTGDVVLADDDFLQLLLHYLSVLPEFLQDVAEISLFCRHESAGTQLACHWWFRILAREPRALE